MTSIVDTVSLSPGQRRVAEDIRALCSDFGDDYWREKDAEADYPHEFVDALSEEGYIGALIPEEYGGAGMTTDETIAMMEEIAASGGGFAAAQAVHGAIYNSVPLVKYGSEAMKEDLLPRVASGETSIQAFGLTEPEAGSDSTSISTFAERTGDGFVINGEKVWTSRVDVSDYVLLMTRTTPRDAVEKRTQGITMFLVDLEDAYEQDAIEMERIEKAASRIVHSYRLWIDDLHVPESAVVGTVGEGFYQMLDGLNEERMVIAAECVGLGEAALETAIDYANDREVFGRPIGKNQAIQHPLAEAYARLDAAKQVVYNAGADLEEGADPEVAGARANTAKYLAADAAFQAADAAVQTHGGFGVAREYDVERYFREARLARLVPITQELALNYVGETVLGLPRSY